MIRRGVDSNILVYAHVAALPQHARVLAFLLEQLREEEVTLVVTPAVLHEFVHIVTDSRRFEEPATMDQALKIARAYLRHSNVLCVGPDEKTVRSAFDFSERYRLGRRRLADTLFAATLIQNETNQVITCNRRDFEVFPELEILDPCTA